MSDPTLAAGPRPQSFESFAAFYPWYLAEHSDRTCRRLHVVGTGLVIATFLYAAVSGHWAALWLAPLLGYGFAWPGHYVFEKNRPATFRHPFYSLMGDFRMFADVVVTRKIRW